MGELQRDDSSGGEMVQVAPGQGIGPSRHSSRILVIGAAVGAVSAVLLALLIAAPLAIAHRQDLPLERQYGNFVVTLATKIGGANQQNPVQGDSRALAAGRYAYTGSCAQCHGAAGDGKGVFGSEIYPPATDLTSADVKEKSDAALFWITKNGLSFTGMPGFGTQYSERDLWSIVSYIRALQSKQSTAVAVPTPTADQVSKADPSGDPVQRGAAVYFAEGCEECHGAAGNAPGQLALHNGGREGTRVIRQGRRGMPAFGSDQITDAQLNDLVAYLGTFTGTRVGLSSRGSEREPFLRPLNNNDDD